MTRLNFCSEETNTAVYGLKVFQAWKSLMKVEFSLDIFILFCWAIWMIRNYVIFKNKNPLCRRYVTVEALLLLHRSKVRITPSLESWINSSLFLCSLILLAYVSSFFLDRVFYPFFIKRKG